MEVYRIKNLLELYADKNQLVSGKSMYKTGQVFNEYAKVQGSEAIFYGTVMDEYRRQNYTAMARVDLLRGSLIECSCDCHNVLLKNTQTHVCAHVVAAVYKGLDKLMYKDEEENENENEGVVIAPEVFVSMASGRNGMMKMNFEIKEIDKNEYRKIYNAFKENKKLYRLPDGRCLDIKDEALMQTLKLIDLLGVYNEIEDIKIPEHKALYLNQIIEEEVFSFIDGKKYITNVMNKLKKQSMVAMEVPESLKDVLRSYQVEGFEFLTTLAGYSFGGILADEMGLGKTLQVITFLLAQKGRKHIVITPTALIYNWKSEIDKFAPDLKVGIAHGVKGEREKILTNQETYDVILTTYTTFRNDLEHYKNLSFDYCIIDEAQHIKNPEATITKALKTINAKVKFALTGTPIENNLLELWSIFDFVMPGYLYNKLRFQNIFINDEKNRAELKELIKPFMLRRTKKEVIKELPDKIEQKLVVEMDVVHRRAYMAYIKLIKQSMETNGQNNMALFSYLTKLRQMTLVPELMVKNFQGNNSKLEVLVEMIKEAGDRKILVFSQFTKVLGLIGERLEKEGIGYSYLDGQTPAADRLKRVEEFNQTDKHQVFLISLKAGGTGLNLTSASIVVHFDPWWNPAAENQASDRAHRIGQKNVVNVIKLIAKDTVEERVLMLQESKKELIEEIMEGNLDNSHTLKNLSKDELISLFMD